MALAAYQGTNPTAGVAVSEGSAVLSRPQALSTAAPVLQEPSIQEFWHFLRRHKTVPLSEFQPSKGAQVPRFKDLDGATFHQLVRDGVPFVVEDCAKGSDEDAIDKFQCQDFAKRWPFGNMRAEYTPDQYHILLRDPTWYSKVELQRGNHEHMSGGAKIAGPYIWHVKDEEPLQTKRAVQQHWRTPYFLEPSLTNRLEANESFEFWFSMAGGGTFSHADAYCESTISFQFSGKKRWRIQAFPEIRHYLNATSFGDEQIYDNKQHVGWTPEAEFTVGPGECFVFPTGYLHETFVDPSENDEGCFTSATFQFNHPRQVNLYRAFLSRFSMSHFGMGEPCVQRISSYATLLEPVSTNDRPERSKSDALASKLMAKLDDNGDGLLTEKELFSHFCTRQPFSDIVLRDGNFFYPWVSQLGMEDKHTFTKEALSVWSEDAIQYHDLNRDGSISLEELSYNLLHWHVVQYRQHTIRGSASIKSATAWFKFVLEREQHILSSFYCESSAACPVLDELTAFGQSVLKSKNKELMLRKQTQVLRMFEADGADEESLTLVDRATGKFERATVREVRGEL